MDELVESSGVLRYSFGPEGAKLIVEVDVDIAKLARRLLAFAGAVVNATRYAPHITVVRKETLTTSKLLRWWGRYEGKTIKFQYNPVVDNDDVYYWHRVWSEHLVGVRKELGLPAETEYTRPPDGASCYHITVANSKRSRD